MEVYNGSNIIQSFDIDFRKLFRAGKINLLTPELTSLPINTIIFLSENSFLVTDVVFNHAKASPSLKFLYTQISTAKQTEQDAVDFDKMDLKLTSARDKFKKISDVIARKKMELEQAHIAAIKTRKLIDNQAKKDELLKVLLSNMYFFDIHLYCFFLLLFIRYSLFLSLMMSQLKAALVQADAEAVAVEKLEMKEWESLRALRDFSTDSKY